MTVPLSISIDEAYSPRQAAAVMTALQEEAELLRLRLQMIEITTHDMPAPRVLICARCLTCGHGIHGCVCTWRKRFA